MKKYIFIIIALISLKGYSQKSDSTILSEIYKNALTSYESYNCLKMLCDSAKGRMVGTRESERAISILENQIKKTAVDTIFYQDYFAPAWYRKSEDAAIILPGKKKINLNVATLGLSVSTPAKGTEAELLEVMSLNELDSLGEEKIKGKIVFFNRPMDHSFINTFESYRDAFDQRIYGPDKAAEYGAVGVIVRSLAINNDDYPRTGVTIFDEETNKIPALSVSTNDAEKLSKLNASNLDLKLWIHTDIETKDSIDTRNLIAEIRGTKHPDKIILVGAHIDSWFNTEGAHDDGAGCIQVTDVLRIFKELQLKTNHTIRLVLFMDEEINQSGAKEYAKYVKQEGKEHIIAIEADRGGFSPIGFTIDANDSITDIISNLTKKMDNYGIYTIIRGFSGVDINKLKEYNVPLIGLLNNNQRYFDYQHAESDTFDKVNRREMQLGTASIAGLVYLIDKYWIK